MPKFNIKAKRKTIPELIYQTDLKGKVISPIPYIETTQTDPMPIMLFVEEAFNTGEFEVGDGGTAEPIFEFEVRQFLDMRAVKEVLTTEEFDRVRVALGMDKSEEAKRKGEEMIKRIEESLAGNIIDQKQKVEKTEEYKKIIEETNKKVAKKGKKN
jgi:hypothetical protein